MVGVGFLIAIGPAIMLMLLGGVAYWALTHGPRGGSGA
jgi:hypothetical protein